MDWIEPESFGLFCPDVAGVFVGCEPFAVLRQAGKLDAVVGEHRVDEVGNRVDQGVEEGRGRRGIGALDEPHEGELRGPVGGNKQIELAFGGSYLGDIDVELADRVALEGPLRRLVALDLGEPTDAVSQEAAVQA